MVRTSQNACSARTRTILFILLMATVLAGAYALFMMPQVTENFDVVEDKKVLLVHAEWCGHCRTLLAEGGVWEQLKVQLPGLTFVELEESDATAEIARYGITGFPDIRIVDATGESVLQFTGARDVGTLKAFLLQNVMVAKRIV